MEIEWHTEPRSALEAWENDVGSAAFVQMDWPAAAGPPESPVLHALRQSQMRWRGANA
ncbi:hypothetical protein ABDB91_17400 [Desulfoscipio sp. XC116]|uniref:hypothetical protein n=1 Tax=Desulfoscipio sp. XC116 TaxID=3144975 RepID=UPI00325B8AE4